MAHFSDVTGRILFLLLFHIFSNNLLFYVSIPVPSPSHSPIPPNTP